MSRLCSVRSENRKCFHVLAPQSRRTDRRKNFERGSPGEMRTETFPEKQTNPERRSAPRFERKNETLYLRLAF